MIGDWHLCKNKHNRSSPPKAKVTVLTERDWSRHFYLSTFYEDQAQGKREEAMNKGGLRRRSMHNHVGFFVIYWLACCQGLCSSFQQQPSLGRTQPSSSTLFSAKKENRGDLLSSVVENDSAHGTDDGINNNRRRLLESGVAASTALMGGLLVPFKDYSSAIAKVSELLWVNDFVPFGQFGLQRSNYCQRIFFS